MRGNPLLREGPEKAIGNPLFVVLRARRSCIIGHRAGSKALAFKMHVGATPSGPGPSAKNSNSAGGVSK
jgi:hypothetical protein